MPMPDHIANSITEEARHGGVTMTTRGRSVTIRFGLPAGRVLRNYDDKTDTWLAVRKVYRDGGFRWNTVGLTRDWKANSGRIVSNRICSRVKSRKRLETIIRSMSMGSGGAYIEVLPWREDQKYPAPKPLAEIEGGI